MIAIQLTIPTINIFLPFSNSSLLPELSGGDLASVVADPPVALQLDPQANPVGQHPPPTVSAQLNHPFAHLPVPPVIVGAGATIVLPSDTIVVDDTVGQDVVSQSRPV